MRHLKLKLIISAVLIFSTAACQSNISARPPSRELTVFAAASLTEAFSELSEAFEANNPGVKVILNLAGSQQLAQQLVQGAPADVFASADSLQMQVAVEAGRIAPGQPAPFAHNRLVIVLPESNPAGLGQVEDLARPGVQLVLAVEQVPVGHYTQSFLVKAGQDPNLGEAFRRGVLDNVVSYEENVKAVLSKVVLGEADAGIVYTSDLTDGNSQTSKHLDIPEHLNMVASYLIAPVEDAHQPELANAYIDYARSPSGQDILSKHGFSLMEK
jgi:molybdate transport system substrate-binding protein